MEESYVDTCVRRFSSYVFLQFLPLGYSRRIPVLNVARKSGFTSTRIFVSPWYGNLAAGDTEKSKRVSLNRL